VRADIKRIELVANTASGSVGLRAPEEARAIFAEYGVEANVRVPAPGKLMECLNEAVGAAPDLLMVLAGDGTARAAAELCGPKGPLLAPLAGGTMNMLPHAVYGPVPWQEALRATLEGGEVRMLGGGEVEGQTFLVAAILGSPALWAPAREAARDGKIGLAFSRATWAWKRAFSGRLRYGLDQGLADKAEALVFLCPQASRALHDEEQVLEAAAMDLVSGVEAFRLGLHALLGDWRNDPKVLVRRCRSARLWASGGIPALLDGEPVRLKAHTQVRWNPAVVQILVAPKTAAEEAPA
jgi:diacylglycerol kinase family enzyme